MADARGGMRNVWLLTGCMTGLSICYTMLIPFLPVYLLELGVGHDSVAIWSGVVFSITFFCSRRHGADLGGAWRTRRGRSSWPFVTVF